MSNKLIILTLLSLLITACGTAAAGGVSAVTPLPKARTPTPSLTATATLTSTNTLLSTDAATLTPTATPSPTPIPADPPATPTLRSIDIPLGEAAAIAAATDAAIQPTVENFIEFEDYPFPLNFEEFYAGYNLRKGLLLSDKLVSLDGKEVTMEGYMAPPLKPELDFFVLTRIQLAYCPFCSTASDWPDDIALVYLDEPVEVTGLPIQLTGRLEVGPSVDEETGMVSLVRIYASNLEVAN